MGRLAQAGALVGAVVAVVGAYGAGGQDASPLEMRRLEARVATLEARAAEDALPPPLVLPSEANLSQMDPLISGLLVERAVRESAASYRFGLMCDPLVIGTSGETQSACVRYRYDPDAPTPPWLEDFFAGR